MGFSEKALLAEALIVTATTLGSGHGPLSRELQSATEALEPQLSVKPFLTEKNQIPLSELREFSSAGTGLLWRPVSDVPPKEIEKEMPWSKPYLDEIKKNAPNYWPPTYIMVETGPWSEGAPQTRFTEISIPMHADEEGLLNIVASRSQDNGRPGKIELRINVLRITQESHAVVVTEYLSEPLSPEKISMGLTSQLPKIQDRARTIFLPRSQVSAEKIRAANTALWAIPWQNALLSTGIIDNDGLKINYTKLHPPIKGSFPFPNRNYYPGKGHKKHPPRLAIRPGGNHRYPPLRQKYHQP